VQVSNEALTRRWDLFSKLLQASLGEIEHVEAAPLAPEELEQLVSKSSHFSGPEKESLRAIFRRLAEVLYAKAGSSEEEWQRVIALSKEIMVSKLERQAAIH